MYSLLLLGIGHDYHSAFENSDTNKAGFAINETRIFDNDGVAIKYFWHIHDINAMLTNIGKTFGTRL